MRILLSVCKVLPKSIEKIIQGTTLTKMAKYGAEAIHGVFLAHLT